MELRICRFQPAARVQWEKPTELETAGRKRVIVVGGDPDIPDVSFGIKLATGNGISLLRRPITHISTFSHCSDLLIRIVSDEN